MTRVTLGFAEQSEELGLGQLSLPEHLVEQPSRDVAGLLMAHPDQENLTGRQGLLPGLVFLAADPLKTGAPQDHPEFAVGGRRHLGFEESARSCRSGIEAESPDVRGVDCAVGALAESLKLRRVLLRVVQSHIDQILECSLSRVAFGSQVEFRTEGNEGLVARFDDCCKPGLGGLQNDRHGDPPLSEFNPSILRTPAEDLSPAYQVRDGWRWRGDET